MTLNPAILKAGRLRAVLNMPEYQELLGAWIDEALADALHQMTTAKEPYEFHKAQGAYVAIESIKTQIADTFSAEEAALARIQKQLNKQDD